MHRLLTISISHLDFNIKTFLSVFVQRKAAIKNPLVIKELLNRHSKTQKDTMEEVICVLIGYHSLKLIYRKIKNYLIRIYVDYQSILVLEVVYCRCNENEFDQFIEVDLSYQCSPSLTVCYDSIPALHNLISTVESIYFNQQILND